VRVQGAAHRRLCDKAGCAAAAGSGLAAPCCTHSCRFPRCTLVQRCWSAARTRQRLRCQTGFAQTRLPSGVRRRRHCPASAAGPLQRLGGLGRGTGMLPAARGAEQSVAWPAIRSRARRNRSAQPLKVLHFDRGSSESWMGVRTTADEMCRARKSVGRKCAAFGSPRPGMRLPNPASAAALDGAAWACLHIPRLTHTQAEKARAAHTPQALQAALGRDCSSARCGAAPVVAREVRALRLSRCRSAIQHEHTQPIANAGLAALHGWPLLPSPSTPAVSLLAAGRPALSADRVARRSALRNASAASHVWPAGGFPAVLRCCTATRRRQQLGQCRPSGSRR
jgi:hypothetical protein